MYITLYILFHNFKARHMDFIVFQCSFYSFSFINKFLVSEEIGDMFLYQEEISDLSQSQKLVIVTTFEIITIPSLS